MSTSKSNYHHGNLREALIRAGYELLSARPGTEISQREVARAAGVSHNAPSNHFADRRALLQALAIRGQEESLAAKALAAESARSPEARLLAIGAAYVRFAAEHPHVFQLMYDADLMRGAPEQLREIQDQHRVQLVEAIRECYGTERATPALANGLWATVHGMANLVLFGALAVDDVHAALEQMLPAQSDRAAQQAE